MKNFLRIQIVTLVLLITLSGCNAFDPGDVRDNVNDPGSNLYIPDQPSEISLSITDDLVTIHWNDNTNFEDGYKIKQSVDDTSSYAEVAMLDSNSTRYKYELKEKGLVLHIKVEAFAENNQKALPDSILQKLTATIPIIDISNLKVHFPKENLAGISWRAPLGIETGYKIYQKTLETSFAEIGEVSNDGLASQLFRHEYSYQNKLYIFKVVPIKDSTVGLTSNKFEIKYYKPNSPNLQLKSVSASSLDLYWNQYQREPYPVELVIERKSSGNNYSEIARLSGNKTNFRDTNLDTSLTYKYRIKTITSNYAHIEAAYITKPQNTKSLLQKSGITDIELNPANKDIAVIFFDYPTYGSNQRHAGIWNLENNLKKVDLGSNVKSIEYNTDGTEIIITDFESAKIYNSNTGSRLFSHSIDGKSYFDASFSSDSEYFTIGGSNLTVWNADNYSQLKKYNQFPLITGVEFNPANNREIAFTTHYSEELFLIDAFSGEINLKIETPETISSFSFSQNGEYIGTFLFEKFMLWKTGSGELVQTWNFDKRIFLPKESEGIQFLNNNKILVGAYLLDISSGMKEKLDIGDNKSYDFPSEMEYSKDETRFYVAYESIDVWEFIQAWYAD